VKIIKYFLSLVFVAASGFVFFKVVIHGLAPVGLLSIPYFAIILASIHRLGGKFVRYLAYGFAGILSCLLLSAIAVILLTLLYGHPFESISFAIGIGFAVVGLLSIFSIKHENQAVE